MMRYAFISGVPASGKSHLAAKVASAAGVHHIEIDKWREEMRGDPELRKWVDFFCSQDETVYWRTTKCDQHWDKLRDQSEAIWPAVLQRIRIVQKSGKPTIFEGVNILPHLAHRDLKFAGVVLLGESFEAILERNKKNPRWGQTEELQKKEAEAFYNCERPWYEKEAKKYGFKTFTDPGEAEKELLKNIVSSG